MLICQVGLVWFHPDPDGEHTAQLQAYLDVAIERGLIPDDDDPTMP